MTYDPLELAAHIEVIVAAHTREAAQCLREQAAEIERLQATCNKYSEDEILLNQKCADLNLRLGLRIGELVTELIELRTAAQAVVDRWETPLWKDAPATAVYIADLRDAFGETK